MEQPYHSGLPELEKGNTRKATQPFDQIDLSHPQSERAPRDRLMAAHALYLDGQHDEAIESLDQFVQPHRTRAEVPHTYGLNNPSKSRFSLEAKHEEKRTIGGTLNSARPQSRNIVSYKGDAQLSDWLHLGLQGTFAETQRSAGKGARSFLTGNSLNREQNVVTDNQISFGLLSNRLRLTSRQAVSNFSYDNEDEREGEQGQALTQRIDADLWKGKDASLSTFAEHSFVDDTFRSTGLSGKPQSLSQRNRRTYSLGGTVGWGPIDLTLSRNFYERANASEGLEEETYKALLNLSLSELRSDSGDLLGGGFSEVAPDSVWFIIEPGVARPGGGSGDEDATQNLSFGMSWYRNGAYGDLSFWQYSYDSRQAGAADQDWIGKGASAGFGLYGDTWNIDLSAAIDSAENKETYSRSADLGYDATLSISYKPDGLPDLSLGLTFGRYGTRYLSYGGESLTDLWELSTEPRYLAYGGESLTELWELGAELDFTKLWPHLMRSADSRLKAIYWFRQTDTLDDFAGQSGKDEHVIGILYWNRW